jgi:glucose-1-phosphatase
VASATLRAIIFDIGRVLVRLDFERVMDGLASDYALSPAEIWTALENDPRWKDWQEGRISPRDWHLHLGKRFGGSLTFEQFTQVWNRIFVPEPMQEDAFLQKLSKRYRLALLSNTDPIHVTYIERNYDFFRHFPVRIYSCAVGVSKPDPLIYGQALRACKVQATQAVFIDDLPANVEAAQRLGMAGIVYKSPDQLREELRSHGV